MGTVRAAGYYERHIRAALDSAREHLRRCGDEASLVDAATQSGIAWTDLGRLDEAESVLGSALAAALARGDAPRIAAASLGLSRCAFWAGRYVDAEKALEQVPSDDHRMAADAAVAASRAAVGSRDVGRALGAAREAIDRARAAGGRSLAARAAYAAAFAHLAVGDLDAVEREAGECLRAAHA